MEKPTNKERQPFRDSIELQPDYARTNIQAITHFLKENVHIVTLNTIWFRVLIDPFISRH